jgi:hypothetical protein
MALAVIPGRTRIVATPRLKGSVIPGISRQAGAGQGTLAEFDSSVERNSPEAWLDSPREIQIKKFRLLSRKRARRFLAGARTIRAPAADRSPDTKGGTLPNKF